MGIVSGGSGGGGLPTGWTESGSPADVLTHGGFLALGNGVDVATLRASGLFVDSTNGFVEVDDGGLIFVAQSATGGEVIIGEKVNAAPPDGDLSAGQVALWFDKTSGSPKFMLKGKQADGTVVTAAVALA